MTRSTPPINELLATANTHARDVNSLCVDVTSMLFPTAINGPTEEMLSAVSTKLSAIITAIYSSVTAAQHPSEELQDSIWRLLAQSGFLRDRPLIDFLMARHVEDYFRFRMAQYNVVKITDQLPARLMNDENPNIAAAAHAILAANSLNLQKPDLLYQELSSEILHKLCWQIVATIQFSDGKADKQIVDRAKTLLRNHDEAQICRVAAKKLIYLLGDDRENDRGDDVFDPELAGLDMFIAAIGQKTELDHDYILRLIAGDSIAPIAILFRACDISKERAISVVTMLRGIDFSSQDILVFDQNYDILSREAILSELAIWASERGAFFASSPVPVGAL